MQTSGTTNESLRRINSKKFFSRMGGPVGTTLTAVSGVAGYNGARAEGAGVVGASVQGLSDAFLIDLIGWQAYLGGAAVMGVGKGAYAAGKHGYNKSKEYNQLASSSPFSANTFVDTEQTYTMRQAGLSMIQNSAMNTKKATLGNEAMFMHR